MRLKAFSVNVFSYFNDNEQSMYLSSESLACFNEIRLYASHTSHKDYNRI